MSARSKSKYTMRFDSSSPLGPAVAVSSTTALALSTALVSVVGCWVWVGCSGGGFLHPASNASEATITAVEIRFFIVHDSLRKKRSPQGLTHFAGVGIQPRRSLPIDG